MISADINKMLRRKIYARDGYRCALCDDSRNIQIHHIVHRSRGGSNHEHNLITLCSLCHAAAHGNVLSNDPVRTQNIAEQCIVEYMADMYAPEWNPYRKGCHPLERGGGE